jgi:hypothetical protein
MARRITFEGACTRCENGLWQGRAGYACHTCGGTGKVTVALKPGTSEKLMKARGWGLEVQTWVFQVVTAKGTVTREKYMAAAVQTADRRVFDCGQTIGGWYEHERPAQLAGSETFVYGVTGKGELVVMHSTHGGYGTTGERKTPNGAEVTTAVRVTEEAAAAAIRELCEREGIVLSEHAEASAVVAG